ncbi:MAG: serine protease Do [Verrucomicrobiales bacterium]|jgi:serine protease Do
MKFLLSFLLATGFSFAQETGKVEGLGELAETAQSRFHIGATFAAVPEDLQFELLLKPKEGLFVREVKKDSPAAKAGLKEGDVIAKIGDAALNSIDQLNRAFDLAGKDAKAIELTIYRAEELRKISVTPAKREGAAPSLSDNPFAPKSS